MAWSTLPKELLENIFRRLIFTADLPKVTSICSSWRSQGLQCIPQLLNTVGLVVPGENINSETRSLLRPAKFHSDNNDIRDENTASGALVESKFYCYNNDINAQDIPVPHRYYCCGTGFGWLILIDDSLDMHLFNPLSGAKIQLPSGATAESSAWRLKRFGKCFVDKAFLSCEPALSSLAQTHALIIHGGNMGFCKLGDEAWTIVVKYDGGMSVPGNICRVYKDAVYYKDKFYVVYEPGGFVTVDTNSDPPELVVYEKLPPGTRFSGRSLYLVESMGDLFQVRRDVVYDGDRGYDSDDEIWFVNDINQAEEDVDDNTDSSDNDNIDNGGSIDTKDNRSQGDNDGGIDIRDDKVSNDDNKVEGDVNDNTDRNDVIDNGGFTNTEDDQNQVDNGGSIDNADEDNDGGEAKEHVEDNREDREEKMNDDSGNEDGAANGNDNGGSTDAKDNQNQGDNDGGRIDNADEDDDGAIDNGDDRETEKHIGDEKESNDDNQAEGDVNDNTDGNDNIDNEGATDNGNKENVDGGEAKEHVQDNREEKEEKLNDDGANEDGAAEEDEDNGEIECSSCGARMVRPKLFDGLESYRTTRCKVFKLGDHEGGRPEWEKVESIGDRAFFVGQNGTFSLSTSIFPGYRPNSIYFTDDNYQQAQYAEAVRHDIGVFKLEDKTVEHIYPIDAKPVMPYPFWYAPFQATPI